MSLLQKKKGEIAAEDIILQSLTIDFRFAALDSTSLRTGDAPTARDSLKNASSPQFLRKLKPLSRLMLRTDVAQFLKASSSSERMASLCIHHRLRNTTRTQHHARQDTRFPAPLATTHPKQATILHRKRELFLQAIIHLLTMVRTASMALISVLVASHILQLCHHQILLDQAATIAILIQTL
jgi:hypothetical protein